MYIVFVAVEAVPFAKIGGVADVIGCLPKELAELGHRIQVVLPLHQSIDRSSLKKTNQTFTLELGQEQAEFCIWRGSLPDSDVTVNFIENDHYFGREEMYGIYEDNAIRYAFFSLAVLETVNRLQIPCQVLHLHDWPTALIPIYFKLRYKQRKHFRNTSTLFTVHNLIYQGIFPKSDLNRLGIPEKYFDDGALEYFGELNLMKVGLLFADNLSTVSRSYAKEIQSKQFGHGLDGIFRERRRNLYGVVNGVDYSIWNPVCDPLIPFNYTSMDLSGKRFCKHFVQKQFSLEETDKPLIAMISRLDHYKGVELVTEIIEKALNDLQVQFILLGQGEEKYVQFFQDIRDKYSNQVAVYLSYNEKLAHLIEAGADMYLMPSFTEPCGLNQLYSMRYGTIPIVRQVGGLADTVVNCNQATLTDESASGFSFVNFTPDACYEAIQRAIKAYNDSVVWGQLQYLAMGKDWSWDRSAREYVELYHLTPSKRLS